MRPNVGDVVKWHDSLAVEHNALVTSVFSDTCINVVVISRDESKTDPYGRQIERHTSQVHKSVQPAHGHYWRRSEESPNPIVQPVAT